MGVSLVMLAMIMFQGAGQQQNPPQQPDRNRAAMAIEESIKGKENMPAEEVFKNIQVFKGRPAIQVLRIMEYGFSPALGVRCNHCHEPGKWDSDAKEQKQVAREMSKMSTALNEQLKKITGKDDAAVNCTTCHRGDTKPALNLPSQRRGG
jgi:hypothetical protein